MSTRKIAIITAMMLLILARPYLKAETLYVTPFGSGLRDGSSWDNAATCIADLINGNDSTITIMMRSGSYHALDIDFTSLAVKRMTVISENGLAFFPSLNFTDSRKPDPVVSIDLYGIHIDTPQSHPPSFS